jgi:hypothetical protein
MKSIKIIDLKKKSYQKEKGEKIRKRKKKGKHFGLIHSVISVG